MLMGMAWKRDLMLPLLATYEKCGGVSLPRVKIPMPESLRRVLAVNGCMHDDATLTDGNCGVHAFVT